MMYNSNVEKLARAARDAEKEADELQERMQAARKAARAAARSVAKATGSKSFNAHALYAHQEAVGYSAEHANALYYLRTLPLDAYLAELRPFADAKPRNSLIAIEHEAVSTKLKEWDELGAVLYLDQEWRAYAKDCDAFRQWQAENPDKVGWREKPATRRQYFLMWRTAMACDIEYPKSIKRGAAHDWLNEHGANRRLKAAQPSSSNSEQEAQDD